MNISYIKLQSTLCTALMLFSPLTFAFDSGSSGVDGALNITEDTLLPLPADGIFNYTTVNVAAGATLTFAKNSANTPVVILASGDVTIEGTIDISGSDSTDVGSAGDGNFGDDGIAGLGGPGGFDGGRGGRPDPSADVFEPARAGGHGLGPGGGEPGLRKHETGNFGCGAAGGSFGGVGEGANRNSPNSCDEGGFYPEAGPIYGNATLLPLIGGSGGGGGYGYLNFHGSGGGGGGGAILIASSGTVNLVSGSSIFANGGGSGTTAGADVGGAGGGGSGGAIRIIATTIDGNGAITATGGSEGGNSSNDGGLGGDGRIRLEAETFLRPNVTNPPFVFAAPGDVFVASMPTLSITSVGGVAAPANPTGNADIVFPVGTANPVTVNLSTTNVPIGTTTVDLTVAPAFGDTTVTTSAPLTGSEQLGSANVSVDLPDGPSSLSAQLSFTVVADAMNFEDFSRYADGEPVERVILRAGIGPQMASTTTFITKSGKEYTWPSNAVALPN